MADKLKPCPFCGDELVKLKLDDEHEPYGGEYWNFIECQNCNAKSGLYRWVEEAIAAWNKRVTID